MPSAMPPPRDSRETPTPRVSADPPARGSAPMARVIGADEVATIRTHEPARPLRGESPAVRTASDDWMLHIESLSIEIDAPPAIARPASPPPRARPRRMESPKPRPSSRAWLLRHRAGDL
jgi:hypothetical protein